MDDSQTTPLALPETVPTQSDPAVVPQEPVVAPAQAMPPEPPITPPEAPTAQMPIPASQQSGSTTAGQAPSPLMVRGRAEGDTESNVARRAKGRASQSAKRQKKLQQILDYAAKRKTFVNDDIQKLLRVSDATATRYLSELVKHAKLIREGTKSHATYRLAAQ